jgi:gliding motility-associated-like protein
MKIKDAPVIILHPQDTTIISGSSLQLNASITGNVDHFAWIPQTGLNNPSILNPVATPAVTTTYQLQAIDPNGCEATEKITIKILTDILIPGAFTPNNDGKNDIFRIPPGSAFTLTQFSVYNRWGHEIFKTMNINEGWNGTSKGIRSPVGSYVYLITGKTTKGNILLKGTIVLIR